MIGVLICVISCSLCRLQQCCIQDHILCGGFYTYFFSRLPFQYYYLSFCTKCAIFGPMWLMLFLRLKRMCGQFEFSRMRRWDLKPNLVTNRLGYLACKLSVLSSYLLHPLISYRVVLSQIICHGSTRSQPWLRSSWCMHNILSDTSLPPISPFSVCVLYSRWPSAVLNFCSLGLVVCVTLFPEGSFYSVLIIVRHAWLLHLLIFLEATLWVWTFISLYMFSDNACVCPSACPHVSVLHSTRQYSGVANSVAGSD